MASTKTTVPRSPYLLSHGAPNGSWITPAQFAALSNGVYQGLAPSNTERPDRIVPAQDMDLFGDPTGGDDDIDDFRNVERGALEGSAAAGTTQGDEGRGGVGRRDTGKKPIPPGDHCTVPLGARVTATLGVSATLRPPRSRLGPG